MTIVLSPSWEAAIISAVGEKMPPAKAQSWQQTAGRFVFKHNRSRHHLREIENIYTKMRDAIDASSKLSELDEQVYSSYCGPLLDELYYSLDGFFEATRSAHDASLSCLCSAGLLQDVPNSLNDYVKKCQKQSDKTKNSNDDLSVLLVSFWNSTGIVVKRYRDCFAHYLSLSGPTWQHSANAVWSHGSWTLSVLLPDNPQINTHRSLTFTSRLDALANCKKFHAESDILVRSILLRSSEHWKVGPIDENTCKMTASNVVIGK